MNAHSPTCRCFSSQGYLQSRRVLGLPADAPMWQRSNATLPPRPIASGETASVQRARYLVQRASGHLLARVRLVRGGGTAPREWVELDVHPENGTADFIIHRQRYQDALAKSWRPGQRFRSFFASPGDPSAGSYFYGRIAAAQVGPIHPHDMPSSPSPHRTPTPPTCSAAGPPGKPKRSYLLICLSARTQRCVCRALSCRNGAPVRGRAFT